ncbi:MAG: hypothetical protein WDZ88_02020 [Candidatus Paceibacterota bacterium]
MKHKQRYYQPVYLPLSKGRVVQSIIVLWAAFLPLVLAVIHGLEFLYIQGLNKILTFGGGIPFLLFNILLVALAALVLHHIWKRSGYK